jgi:two-component system, OmpR family, response regulator VanR
MKHILLVEDEELLREGIQEALEISGFKVSSVENGLEALEAIQKESFHLVISDLVMPKMDGVDFVARLRETQTELPVLIASGSAGAVMARFGLKTLDVPGATAHIQKPFKVADLVALVNELLTQ